VETFQIRKQLPALSLAKPRKNAETILITYEVFMEKYVTLLISWPPRIFRWEEGADPEAIYTSRLSLKIML
jgi:hypothetical protein